MTKRLFAFFLSLGAASSACSERPDPRVTLRSAVIEQLGRTDPRISATITGPLSITIKSTGEGMAWNLDRLYQFCQANTAEECATARDEMVGGIIEVLAREEVGTEKPLPRQLRLVVREAPYCATIEEKFAKRDPKEAPFMTPFVDGICTMLMFDFPKSRRSASKADLDAMNLTTEAALQLARSQVLAPLPKLSNINFEPDTLNAIHGFPDVSSLLLDTDGWQSIAQRAPGKQITILVPDEDLLTVMITDPEKDLTYLKELAREQYTSAQRGISERPLRWTATGWQPVP